MNFALALNSITQQIQANAATVAAAAVAVEQVAHHLPGATKQEIVLNAVQFAGGAAALFPNASVQALAGLVNYTVAVLNAAGIFNHGAPPNIPPPAAQAQAQP